MDQDRRAQWLRGALDLCILALLATGESYGYELSQRLQAAGVGAIQGGTLYPVLLRLQRAGLLTASWREGEAGPARKYYAISPEGRAMLSGVIGEWSAFTGAVDAILREAKVR